MLRAWLTQQIKGFVRTIKNMISHTVHLFCWMGSCHLDGAVNIAFKDILAFGASLLRPSPFTVIIALALLRTFDFISNRTRSRYDFCASFNLIQKSKRRHQQENTREDGVR